MDSESREFQARLLASKHFLVLYIAACIAFVGGALVGAPNGGLLVCGLLFIAAAWLKFRRPAEVPDLPDAAVDEGPPVPRSIGTVVMLLIWGVSFAGWGIYGCLHR